MELQQLNLEACPKKLYFYYKLFWTVSGLFSVTDSTMLSVSESCLSKYVSTTYFLGQDSLMASP